MHRKQIAQLFRKHPEWNVTIRQGGHLVATHAGSGDRVYLGSTPSDHRAMLNVRAAIRRVERNHAGRAVMSEHAEVRAWGARYARHRMAQNWAEAAKAKRAMMLEQARVMHARAAELERKAELVTPADVMDSA